MTVHPIRNDDDPDRGRQLPNDTDAEAAVLGACLLDPRAVDDTIDTGLTPGDFYRPAHEAVWRAITHLHGLRDPIDTIAVVNALTVAGELSRVGGPAFVAGLMAATPAAGNAAYYAAIVRERATLRRLVQAGTKVTQYGYADHGGDVDELVNASLNEVAAVADARHGGRGATLADVADAALEQIDQGVTATPTPWPGLDHLIDGATPGLLYATGARPGVGKTIFALQWACAHAAASVDDGPQVAYFTLEMSAARLYQRALATGSGVDGRRIRRGTLTEDEWAAVSKADGRLRSLPLTIEGASGWTPQQIRARARQLHRDRPVGLVVIDHIGITRAERRRDNRQAELSEAADIALGLAHDLAGAVHILTQLNRGVTQRTDQRPVPSDIRDTDRIEQNSDVVLLLHRDKDKAPDQLQVGVAKNRDGVEGSCTLTFDGPRARITDGTWRP